MPWRPLLEICREVERLPFCPTHAATIELKNVFARRLSLNPTEISDAAVLKAVELARPRSLATIMAHGAQEMKWLASGRRSAGGKREVIHPDHWAFLALDIEQRAARDLDGKVVYADLKGAFGNDLTEEDWQIIESQLAPPSPTSDSKSGTTVPTTEALQPDTEIADTRSKKLKPETEEKYLHWYNLAQDIKTEGRLTRPTQIAREIEKRETMRLKEMGVSDKGTNRDNIKRRLDYHYPGWAN